MRSNFTQLYLHCVWATWNRLPLIVPDIQKVVYAAIIAQCEQMNCQVITIGGIADHVHLLTGFPPTLTVAEMIKQVKGSSSHLVTHQIKPGEFFKWQGSYGAFTVGKREIDAVADYIKNQAIHHQQNLNPAWELDIS